jgi:hypothetical protein
MLPLLAPPFLISLPTFFFAPCSRIVCKHAQGKVGAIVDLTLDITPLGDVAHKPFFFVHPLLPQAQIWTIEALLLGLQISEFLWRRRGSQEIHQSLPQVSILVGLVETF